MSAADTALVVAQSIAAERPTRRCPDCGASTVVVPDPDELMCTRDRCGWSASLKPAAVRA